MRESNMAEFFTRAGELAYWLHSRNGSVKTVTMFYEHGIATYNGNKWTFELHAGVRP